MLDLETINNTIDELEKSDKMTFDICNKLASLYIIKDYITRKNGNNKPHNDKTQNK